MSRNAILLGARKGPARHSSAGAIEVVVDRDALETSAGLVNEASVDRSEVKRA